MQVSLYHYKAMKFCQGIIFVSGVLCTWYYDNMKLQSVGQQRQNDRLFQNHKIVKRIECAKLVFLNFHWRNTNN